MANKTPNLLFKKTWVDFLKEEFGNDPELTMKVFFAICDYAYDGIVPEDTSIRLAIGTIRREIDNDQQAYNELSEKRRNARFSGIEKRKNQETNVDFVDEKQTNSTNATNETTATNVDNIIYSNIDSLSSNDDVESNKNKKKNKKEKMLSEDDNRLAEYMREKFPRVAKMKEPLLYADYMELQEAFGQELLLSVIEKLNNYAKINTYISAKSTLRNWCKLEIERNGNNRISNKPKRDITTSVLEDFFGSVK